MYPMTMQLNVHDDHNNDEHVKKKSRMQIFE